MKKIILTFTLVFACNFLSQAQIKTINVTQDTACTVLNIAAIEPLIETSFYPNPTDGIIYLNNKMTIEESLSVKVFNLNGQLVYRFVVTKNKKLLDVSHLKNGVYMLTYQKEHIKITEKLIINK
jgi:hypothetical protein